MKLVSSMRFIVAGAGDGGGGVKCPAVPDYVMTTLGKFSFCLSFYAMRRAGRMCLES